MRYGPRVTGAASGARVMGGIEGALLALYVSHVNSGEKRARAALSSLFEERAREKQLSRVADDLAVARGEKSREQLRDENAHFARLLHEARVKLAWHRVRAFS